jgi:hypothetical protein
MIHLKPSTRKEGYAATLCVVAACVSSSLHLLLGVDVAAGSSGLNEEKRPWKVRGKAAYLAGRIGDVVDVNALSRLLPAGPLLT